MHNNYTTFGLTQVVSGVLSFDGLAEQGGGQFILGSYTVPKGKSAPIVSSGVVNVNNVLPGGTTNVLGIRNGNILGSGAINGNLNLGNDPLAPGYNQLADLLPNPIISPGFGSLPLAPTQGALSITINGGFQMFSGTMQITILAGNICPFVTVNGVATLSAYIRDTNSSQAALYGGFIQGFQAAPITSSVTDYFFILVI
jgi:hypothetical protein